MTPAIWVALVSAILGSTAMGALIAALANRPKVRAEAVKERAAAESTSSDAWKELLEPYRDEVRKLRTDLELMRDRFTAMASEKEILKAELATAKQQIGILSRHEREAILKQVQSEAVVHTALAAAGISVPDLPTPAAPPMMTRATDPPGGSGR